jgi:hypothetical protein
MGISGHYGGLWKVNVDYKFLRKRSGSDLPGTWGPRRSGDFFFSRESELKNWSLGGYSNGMHFRAVIWADTSEHFPELVPCTR